MDGSSKCCPLWNQLPRTNISGNSSSTTLSWTKSTPSKCQISSDSMKIWTYTRCLTKEAGGGSNCQELETAVSITENWFKSKRWSTMTIESIRYVSTKKNCFKSSQAIPRGKISKGWSNPMMKRLKEECWWSSRRIQDPCWGILPVAWLLRAKTYWSWVC